MSQRKRREKEGCSGIFVISRLPESFRGILVRLHEISQSELPRQ